MVRLGSRGTPSREHTLSRMVRLSRGRPEGGEKKAIPGGAGEPEECEVTHRG